MEASGRWLNDFISMLLGKLKIEFIMLLGNKIKSLRDEQGILQRQVAAYLEIDTPMFSKIERGDRRAKRSQVIQMATYFKVDEKEMLTLWLADPYPYFAFSYKDMFFIRWRKIKFAIFIR